MSLSLARQLASMGIRDERVLEAISRVPRERFVPPAHREEAEADKPLPIGWGQTISQPYIVGLMTEALGLTGRERVLEVGTGSGYQTAVLAALAGEVCSMEIVPELAARARETLEALGIGNVELAAGDAFQGWPDRAPFDRILVTAAPPAVPPRLAEQLAPGGRMIIPVGAQETNQVLKQIDRAPDGTLRERDILAVRFVPMIGMLAS